MDGLVVIGEVASNDSIKTFVDSIITGVTGSITLTSVATVVAGIITAGIVAIFAWKFARKGFAFVKNALSGRNAKI